VLLDLFIIFIDNLVPLLIIAGVGMILRRQFQIEPKPVSNMIFYVFSPALIFWSLYAGEIGGGEFIALFGGTVLFQVLMMLIGGIAARLQGTTSIERAALMLSAFCMNAGNFGLPLIQFAFGEAVMSRAIVVMVANVSVNYTLGVFVASNGRSSVKEAFLNVLKTPAIYAFTSGMLLRSLELQIPVAIERPIASLSAAAIPLMLVLLGIQLGAIGKLKHLTLMANGIIIRLFLSPFIAIGLAALLMMNDMAAAAFIMQCSMPTAVVTIILATEFELDQELMLNLILATTLLSPLTLSVLILLLR